MAAGPDQTTERYGRIRASLLDPAEPEAGCIIVVADISEAKRLEAKLQQAKKMEAIGTLAGGVAHDLNNILSGLVSYPELIMLDLPEDSPLRQPLITVKRSGERAAAVVQDLLTMARRGVSVTEVTNLNSIISQLRTNPEFQHMLDLHPGLKPVFELDEELLDIKGSEPHITTSILNLAINGAEAMELGGTLTIATGNIAFDQPWAGFELIEPGDYATVAISDQGSGIPPEDLQRIFEPFYTKKKLGGSGLGMAVVWGTVKDHNGFIDISSDLGRGTTCRLYFPATREAAAIVDDQSSLEALAGAGETILVVDDSTSQREIARSILEKLGYAVSVCDSGEAAVALVRDRQIDLIVLDMIMDPGIDGLETYERIARFRPDQRFVIASGYSETDRVRTIQRLSGCSYIRKPYTVKIIGTVVREALDDRS